jgi:hypothetical protein
MTKRRKIAYWITTVWLALALVGSGVQQLLRVEGEGALAPPYAWGIAEMGYPVYVLTILGAWKLLGALAILAPRYPLLKEWAYAGIFFLLTGGIFSHIAAGDAWYHSSIALFVLLLTVGSWYLRPTDRRLVTGTTQAEATCA